MNFLRYSLLLCLVTLLAFGCAKKQEDASKIEQEMLGQDGEAVDTPAVTEPEPDVMATAEEADATAMPVEEESTYEVDYGGATGYTVQVAACESLEYAQYLMDKYTRRGYEPTLSATEKDGQTYYRVRLGSFETRNEAVLFHDELKDKYSLEGWLVSPGN